MHPNVHCSTIYNRHGNNLNVHRWMDKEDVVHRYTMEYYSAIKKERNAICSNMDATRDYHTKSERERQIPYDITYMWNLKYDTNEPIYETDSQT